MFPSNSEMNEIDKDIQIRAVERYLKGGTLKQTAKEFSIHRNTLWRWVKSYKERGIKGLHRIHAGTRHWRRLPKATEDSVVALKEAEPSLTVRKAQELLKKRGMEISLKGIWRIWQRFGLIGFAKEQLSDTYEEYLNTVVTQDIMSAINELVNKKELKKAAGIINALPVFPFDEIILHIPARMLSLRKQVIRLRAEFGKMPLPRYIKKAARLRMRLEKNDLLYSSLWVGVAQCYALMWSARPQAVLKVVSVLKKRIGSMHDPRLRFLLLLLEGQAKASTLKIEQAKSCADACKTIIRHSRNPFFFMGGLGGIYSMMGYFREALYWTHKALKGAAPSYREQLYVNLAGFLTVSGDYRSALRVLKKSNLKEWGFRSRMSMIKSFAYLDQGDFQKASAHAVDTLMELKQEGVRRFLHPATLVIACCHQAAGEDKKAIQVLRKLNPLLKKYGLLQDYFQRRLILGDTRIPKVALAVPSLRLTYLLHRARQTTRAKDYRQALCYAIDKKLFGLFMRIAPFFSEPIVHLLSKGKNPGLPRTFLEMPVFRIETPVYEVRFLGKLRVWKRGIALSRLRLTPKEASFLIHMSINKERRISLDRLYRNYWSKSHEPSRNLSHFLLRLKKKLVLPAYLIRLRQGVLYWRVFFTTDLDLFSETLAQAKVLERAGEWNYAKREYLQAFRLFRKPPFAGMYDDWSENMRRVLLNLIESEIKHFEQCCQKHKDMRSYRRIRARFVNMIQLD
jgi:transposase